MALRGVTALVTGAASGLGRATASKVLELGGKVVLVDLAANADAAAEAIAAAGGTPETALFSGADVTSEGDIKATLEAAEASLGTVTAVVNCAGVAVAQKTLSKKGPHDLESFSKVLHVNVAGSFNVARLAAERMAAAEAGGVIVNTASIAAFDGQIGQVAYASSKGAIAAMTLPMARELAPYGIRVCTIAPGLFKTPMLMALPEKVQDQLGAMVPNPARLGDPSEYADTVCHVIQNGYLNGETIRLDGALRMPP
mmetsp:Transcript_22062/g.67756  ORF Transcript_22062/g.67756 Transcript_22062/m.67756 type:complete len:255 (-) Transcript_22062:988-1752(-)